MTEFVVKWFAAGDGRVALGALTAVAFAAVLFAPAGKVVGRCRTLGFVAAAFTAALSGEEAVRLYLSIATVAFLTVAVAATARTVKARRAERAADEDEAEEVPV